MGRKNKNKSATVTRKGRKPKSNSRSAPRKASAKKKKPANIVQAVLNADKLRELYSTMMKCRMLAERIYGAQISQHQPESVISGLEATLVGAGAHLLPQDCIALGHSGYIASLIKGTPLGLILARMRETETNNGAGKATSSQAAAPMKLSMATGLALSQEMKGKGAVTLTFCTHHPRTLAFDPDAMALAAAQKLPMVCLVESSFDARSESLAQGAAGDDPAYYPRIAVDGCDVVAVFRVTQEAIRRAREGHGPALIECLTSRTNGLSQSSLSLDPLTFMEQYLRRRDLWSDEWSRLLVAAFTRELDDALASVHEQTDLDGHFDNVYTADGWKPPGEARA
jgi:acetoin:2,6-dichlorophenolindophenol oxidoreductase subunit alpha